MALAAAVNIAAGVLKAIRWWVFLRPIGVTSPWLALRATLAAALLLSLGAWGLHIVTYHLTARAAGFPISIGATIAGLLAVNLGFLLRVTPGNVGLFQAAYAATAAAYGLDRGAAVGVAFLIQAQQIIPITLIGTALAPELLFGTRSRRGRDETRRDETPPSVSGPPGATPGR